MKKTLLKIASILLLPSVMFAEDTLIKDSTYNTAWFDTLNEHYVVKYDRTYEVKGLKDLTSDNCNWKASNSASAKNIIEVEDGKLNITHTRLTGDDNWTDISLRFVDWFGGSGYKFGKYADTVGGYYVNMTNDVIVTADIKASENCFISMNLRDINGHTYLAENYGNEISGDNILQTYEFDPSEELWDFYGGYFWGVSNGRYSQSQLTVGDHTVKYSGNDYIPFDISKVGEIMWCVNKAKLGEVDQEINIEISNIIVGDENYAKTFYHATDTDNVRLNPNNIADAYYSYKGVILNIEIPEQPEDPTKPEEPTVPVDTTKPETPTIDPSTVREVETTYSENEVAEIVELIKESTSDSLYLTIAEQILEDLLGVDINTIVEDSLVIWYYYGDSQLKTDNTWQLYGYGPQMPVSAEGQYQAKYMDQNGNVVGVSAIYQIGESPEPTVSVEEAKALEISIANKTVSANQSGSFVLTSLDGSVIANSASNFIEIPAEFSGIVLIQFTNKSGEITTTKAFVK